MYDLEGGLGKGMSELMRTVGGMREEIIKESAAKSTGKNWVGAVKRFREFIRTEKIMRGFQEWPPNEFSFCMWLRHCWKVKSMWLRHCWKVKRSLSAMREAHFAIRWACPVVGNSYVVGQMLKAARLQLFKRINRKHHLKVAKIKEMVDACDKRARKGEWGYDMLAAVILLQYAGIARISEVFGCKRRELKFGKGGLGGLSWEYKGKNHAGREGDVKHIAALEGSYCPVRRIKEYLHSRGRLYLPSTGSTEWVRPVFQLKGGKPLSYSWIREKYIVLFKDIGLNPKWFATHSVRSGATTAALNWGCPRCLVKRQGGWVSDAIDSYFLPAAPPFNVYGAGTGEGGDLGE